MMCIFCNKDLILDVNKYYTCINCSNTLYTIRYITASSKDSNILIILQNNKKAMSLFFCDTSYKVIYFNNNIKVHEQYGGKLLQLSSFIENRRKYINYNNLK